MFDYEAGDEDDEQKAEVLDDFIPRTTAVRYFIEHGISNQEIFKILMNNKPDFAPKLPADHLGNRSDENCIHLLIEHYHPSVASLEFLDEILANSKDQAQVFL